MITATVSHEMRTPINAIMTQLDSLDELLQGNRGAQKMTRIIKNSSQLLLYLVNDMLDVGTAIFKGRTSICSKIRNSK